MTEIYLIDVPFYSNKQVGMWSTKISFWSIIKTKDILLYDKL